MMKMLFRASLVGYSPFFAVTIREFHTLLYSQLLESTRSLIQCKHFTVSVSHTLRFYLFHSFVSTVHSQICAFTKRSIPYYFVLVFLKFLRGPSQSPFEMLYERILYESELYDGRIV